MGNLDLWAALAALACGGVLFVGAWIYSRAPLCAGLRQAYLEGRRKSSEVSPVERIADSKASEMTKQVEFFGESLPVAEQALAEKKLRDLLDPQAKSRASVVVDHPTGLVNRAERRRLGLKSR